MGSLQQSAQEFWWMKEGAFANPIQARAGQAYGSNADGSSGGKSINNIGGNTKSSQTGFSNGLPTSASPISNLQQDQGLPATQGLVQTGPQVSSCPSVSSAPSLAACVGRNSDCWSVGMQDVDCINNALCCFDGCANVCQGQGPILWIPKPQFNARGQKRQDNNNKNNNNHSNNNNVNVDDTNNAIQGEKGNGLLFPPPQSQGIGNTYTDTNDQPDVQQNGGADIPKQQNNYPQQQNNFPQQQQNNNPQQNNNIPQNKNVYEQNNQPKPFKSQSQESPTQFNSNNHNSNSATQRPFVKCPSAMLCTPKVYCDLEGSITKNAIEPNPLFEDLRVPLIPCINRERGNQIDVCCRDPDYKDQQQNNVNQQGQSKNNNGKTHNKKGKFNKNNGKKQGQTNYKHGAINQQNVRPKQKQQNTPLNISNNPFISSQNNANGNIGNQGNEANNPERTIPQSATPLK